MQIYFKLLFITTLIKEFNAVLNSIHNHLLSQEVLYFSIYFFEHIQPVTSTSGDPPRKLIQNQRLAIHSRHQTYLVTFK